MNEGPRETEVYFSQLKRAWPEFLDEGALDLLKSGKLRACLIPPHLSLVTAKSGSAQVGFPLEIAAQNAHWEKKGAFTGETSGLMLKEIGVSWVLVGHSERRQFFGETDETARKRAESLLEQGFTVIFCIGEHRAEREAGKTNEVLAYQLKSLISGSGSEIAGYLKGQLILAYEPVWAIGTGLSASPQQVQETHQAIRKFLELNVGKSVSESTSILYGGSVTPENAKAIFACPDVDGVLVGGASLKPESFLSLLRDAARS